MVNVRELDVPPPGAGLTTVTSAVPAEAMSVAEMFAVTSIALTKNVVRLTPFHCTVEPGTKFVPNTVKANPAPPAVAELGDRLVVVGTGLLMVKVCAFDVPPPGVGLNTVTLAEPADAMSAADMLAVT